MTLRQSSGRTQYWGLTIQRGPWKETPQDKRNEMTSLGSKTFFGGGVQGAGKIHAGHAGAFSAIDPIAPPEWGNHPQPMPGPSRYAQGEVVATSVPDEHIRQLPPGRQFKKTRASLLFGPKERPVQSSGVSGRVREDREPGGRFHGNSETDVTIEEIDDSHALKDKEDNTNEDEPMENPISSTGAAVNASKSVVTSDWKPAPQKYEDQPTMKPNGNLVSEFHMMEMKHEHSNLEAAVKNEDAEEFLYGKEEAMAHQFEAGGGLIKGKNGVQALTIGRVPVKAMARFTGTRAKLEEQIAWNFHSGLQDLLEKSGYNERVRSNFNVARENEEHIPRDEGKEMVVYDDGYKVRDYAQPFSKKRSKSAPAPKKMASSTGSKLYAQSLETAHIENKMSRTNVVRHTPDTRKRRTASMLFKESHLEAGRQIQAKPYNRKNPSKMYKASSDKKNFYGDSI